MSCVMLFRQRPYMEAFNAPQCKYGIVGPYRYNYLLKPTVEQLLHDRKPPVFKHQILFSKVILLN